eukprot:CAMPEP_0172479738 /NCGR_PEP_ID=MMETSP1066-20121228/4516_1 /TAXON_ID=671091 /ORGANISM="Coscinodiscus wailesii, Strain CCMP2513" /LENGTH=68 /DNA_ID=CAMNT_0013240455 /DNA_START=57 /DNA_END=259 /DNA_ORIENTATION=-
MTTHVNSAMTQYMPTEADNDLVAAITDSMTTAKTHNTPTEAKPNNLPSHDTPTEADDDADDKLNWPPP